MAARYKNNNNEKFNTEIRNILRGTVLTELNKSHSQLVKQLNNLYAQLQAKEQEEVNEKERQKRGEVPKIVEDALVIGIGNYESVTKKQCIKKLESLSNLKDKAKKRNPIHWSMQKMIPTTRHWNRHWSM